MNIKALVENCATIMEGQIITKELEFQRNFGHIKYPNVLGDELHLRQILINILGNAIKFTPDLQKKGKIIEVLSKDVIREYVKTLGEFGAEDIK